mgnify:CR=1 FL=1
MRRRTEVVVLDLEPAGASDDVDAAPLDPLDPARRLGLRPWEPLGRQGDRFFDAIFMGSGLVFVTMLFAAAAVLMEGSANLERETEDLRVVVVPEINAGTASLAYAVINPAIGLGTWQTFDVDPGKQATRAPLVEVVREVAAAVERGPLSATQFHPEKSGDAGAVLLQNWLGTLE